MLKKIVSVHPVSPRSGLGAPSPEGRVRKRWRWGWVGTVQRASTTMSVQGKGWAVPL